MQINNEYNTASEFFVPILTGGLSLESIVVVIIIIIIIIESFSHHHQLIDFRWGLSYSKFFQVSRTLLSILADLNDTIL